MSEAWESVRPCLTWEGERRGFPFEFLSGIGV